MESIRFKDYLEDYLDINNISKKDFASRIDITPKHLIDILSGNSDMSLQVIESISFVTNIPVNYICKMEMNYKLEKSINDYLGKNNLTITNYINKFDYKFLIKNKWVDFTDKTDKLEIAKDILKFLRVKSPEKVYDIDKSILYKSKNDKPELKLLWLEKCYRLFLKQNVKEYQKENISILIDNIQKMAKNNIFDEARLTSLFNENGVGLVIEDDIPTSKIRGAFKVHKNTPVIYLTRKHQRIADIYFALLHEIAHLKSDYNKAKSTSIISYFNKDEAEQKADERAYNWMVNNKYFNLIKADNNYDIEKEKIYPKAFIAYRLANEKRIEYGSKIYQKHNALLKNN